MIYILSLSSNVKPLDTLIASFGLLQLLSPIKCSQIYDFPAEKLLAPAYKNAAVMMDTVYDEAQLIVLLKEIERHFGRVKDPLLVHLDIDVVAKGDSIDSLQVDPSQLPLPDYVRIPMSDLCGLE